MNAALHVEADGPRGRPHGTWMLLHGWGANLRVFDGLAAALTTDARVLRVDLPGHGRSPFVPESAGFDAQARALLEALPDDALIAGWSLGGQFALRLAQLAPHRVRGIVTIASTPRFVADATWAAGVKPQFIDAFAARLATDWHAVLEEFLSLQVRGSRGAAEVLAALHAALAAHGEPDPRALAAGLRLLRDNDLRESVRRLDRPVLLLSGQHDRVTPPAASAWLAATLPKARHVELPRAGHAPFLSHPAETVEHLRAFAAALAPGRAA